MSPRRRDLLRWAAIGAACGATPVPGAARPDDPGADAIVRGRTLRFPRDHGAHQGARIEWWYATGWLQPDGGAPPIGWQLTFFRSRTGLAVEMPGRFAPRQLLFAHAAISDIGGARHLHAQRLARWSGDEGLPEARAARADTDVVLGSWWLRRAPEPGAARYRAHLPAPEAGFTLTLELRSTQPVLLQGEAGFSRKGPLPAQASHYYSQPQLAVQARLQLGGRTRALAGTGWLDHEWSDELMPPEAVGWDWIGINLADGGALTAFVLRRRDGSVVWGGGSHRPAGGPVRAFAADELAFEPLRHWVSPASGAHYPVGWAITTPLGRHRLEALLDAQELDRRGSTGAIYWEGLAELRDEAGRRIGLGYLEMTGRAAPLKLG